MNPRFLRLARLSITLAATLLIGGCADKVVPVAPLEAPPPPPIPTATLTASPSNVQLGQSVQLSWSTQYAFDVDLAPIGPVAPNGTQTVVPSDSTVYTLRARGPGGTIQATVRVHVMSPSQSPPLAESPPPMAESRTAPPSSYMDLFQRNMHDIYFNYDRYDLRPADADILKADANFLAAHPRIRIVISGHCDERGSEDYNLALGTSRANAVRDELQRLGISSDRIKTISYGKEKPFCMEHNEPCWQQNRRAHFSPDQ